jgi:hypothetical protein
VKAQHAAQPDGTGLGITLRFILDEVWKKKNLKKLKIHFLYYLIFNAT